MPFMSQLPSCDQRSPIVVRKQSIDELDLSLRVANALRSENIFRIGDLTERTRKEVIAATNSPRAVAEIEEKLILLNLNFRQE